VSLRRFDQLIGCIRQRLAAFHDRRTGKGSNAQALFQIVKIPSDNHNVTYLGDDIYAHQHFLPPGLASTFPLHLPLIPPPPPK